MKLLRDQRAIEGLQELICFCASKEVSWSEMCEVKNLHRQKRTGNEMRLNAQIR